MAIRNNTLAGYSLLSVLATIGIVMYAVALRSQFYSVVIFLATSKVAVTILGNMAVVLLVLIGHLCKKVFLGSLREQELESVSEKTWFAMTETCLALTIFREDISSRLVLSFCVLLFIKIFHWLSQFRVEHIYTLPAVSRLTHIRVVSLMTLLLFVDSCFLSYQTAQLLQKGPSLLLLFAFEYVILISTIVSTFLKYVLYMIDLAHHGRWSLKGDLHFYLNIFSSLFQLVVYLVFFALVFSYYGLPLHIVRDLYHTFAKLKDTISRFLRYRVMIKQVHKLPNATAEELAAADETCIVCRETMTAAKKLPCNHMFHIDCLRSWLEQRQTCPTCRATIVPPNNANNANNAAPAPAPAQQQQQPPAAAGAASPAPQAAPAANAGAAIPPPVVPSPLLGGVGGMLPSAALAQTTPATTQSSTSAAAAAPSPTLGNNNVGIGAFPFLRPPPSFASPAAALSRTESAPPPSMLRTPSSPFFPPLMMMQPRPPLFGNAPFNPLLFGGGGVVGGGVGLFGRTVSDPVSHAAVVANEIELSRVSATVTQVQVQIDAALATLATPSQSLVPSALQRMSTQLRMLVIPQCTAHAQYIADMVSQQQQHDDDAGRVFVLQLKQLQRTLESQETTILSVIDELTRLATQIAQREKTAAAALKAEKEEGGNDDGVNDDDAGGGGKKKNKNQSETEVVLKEKDETTVETLSPEEAIRKRRLQHFEEQKTQMD